MRILICDDEQKLIDLELSILQEYCRSTNIAATFFTFTDSLSAGNIGEFDILQSDENVTIIKARSDENVTQRKQRRNTNENLQGSKLFRV